MKPAMHEIDLIVQPDWDGVHLVMHCSWSADDATRPCWPSDEYGKRYDQGEGEAAGCVYIDWVNNQGLESLMGDERTLRFQVAEVEWLEGDGPQFVLGDYLGEATR